MLIRLSNPLSSQIPVLMRGYKSIKTTWWIFRCCAVYFTVCKAIIMQNFGVAWRERKALTEGQKNCGRGNKKFIVFLPTFLFLTQAYSKIKQKNGRNQTVNGILSFSIFNLQRIYIFYPYKTQLVPLYGN